MFLNPQILKGNFMNLNFTLSELIKSDVAKLHNIDNRPNLLELDNLLNLIFHCLQPIRDKLGKPMIITSGYRCPKLNSHPKIKGSVNSNHLYGRAADFHVKGMTVQEVINFILKLGIEFDELGNEYDKWVHIAYRKGNNRKKIFKK